MQDAQIGWIAALLIGAVAGWLAEKVTGSNMGIITNVILGVIGAGIATWLAGMMGLTIPGSPWVAYLISGFIGAFLLIVATRLLRPASWRA